MISLLIIIPVVFGLIILGLKETKAGKQIALFASLIVLCISVYVWVSYCVGGELQEVVNGIPLVVDSISIYFVVLTALLMPICILGMWDKTLSCMGLFLILEGLVMGVFTVMNIVWFYICFEGVLIPMYLIVQLWGSRQRKVRASYYLFMYTLFGSIWLLIGILLIYMETGRVDYMTVYHWGISESKEGLIWLLFFIGLMVKIPMIPLHLWLPEAHVEAPTEGSVVLAGVLLKLGSYGLIRYTVDLFATSSIYFVPLVNVMALIGIIYGSLTAIRQTDIKRVIAYASIAHMNMTLIGLFSGIQVGWVGSIFQMLSHGIVSGGLFLCVGVLYDRLHTREVGYYSGAMKTMPIFGIIVTILMLGNIGFPGTSSFIGEFLIIEGSFEGNPFVGGIGALSMVLGGCYSLWLLNRVLYGNTKELLLDITNREKWLLLPLVTLVLVIGFYPSICLDILNENV